MANPRELAEQAFAILQNALRDSEARAAELDEQLQRKKAPKNKAEEQLDVLQHRLAAVEAERARWQQAASHLEEIAEAERAKVAQLKKKLDIAESGPEKLTKKEINFWRAKAEDIDTETKDYKTRLTNLRKELIERDALIDKLNSAQQSGAAAGVQGVAAAGADLQPSPEIAELRTRLEERERRVAELQTQVEESRALMEAAAAATPPAPSPEEQAQLESLQRQITTFEQALAESHAARAAFKAELAQARSQIADQQRASREMQTDGERTRATLVEREHKIVELSAEIEHTRSELRQREQQVRDGAQRDEQIAALTRDLEALHTRAETDRRDAAHAEAAREQLREALHSAEQRLENTGAELDGVRRALADQERSAHDAAAAIRGLQAAVDERDGRLAERDQRLAERNQRLDERDQRLADTEQQLDARNRQLAASDERLAELDQQLASYARQDAERGQQLAELEQRLAEGERRLAEAGRQLADIDQQLAERNGQVADRDRRITDLSQELDEHLRQNSTHLDQLAERDERLAAQSAELEQARTAVQATNRELTSLRDTLLGSNREIELLRTHKHGLEQELSDLLARAAAAADAAAHKDDVLQRAGEQVATLERQRDEMREQMAGLEAELKEEKENAENLGQLANERREAMTKLQEQVEEADERYEEAKWRLGKAQYFERLVKRRKGLIGALLGALRAKMKANVALKAGLDGLRTYKAAAEVNQQKLLQRIDTLKTELKEAEETVDRHQGSTLAKEQLADTQAKALTLEARLNTQAELILALESELKIARATMKSGDEKNQEIVRLHKELEAKNQHVERLQMDADEQQRKLAKLRGSESETMRLKAISEKDRGSIDALEREIAQLREALTRQSAVPAVAGAASSNPELEAKLKERENSLTRLMGTIKEHEATIKKLAESADSWKRKYHFLSTDSPDAYKTAAEK